MIKKLDVYKCELCGNMVEVVHVGGGTLVCCGQDMTLMAENTVEAAQEKHIPVIEKTADGVLVKVGSIAHPMEEKHYIQFIEVIANGKSYRQFLNPGDKPEALFKIDADAITARAYCNLHGFWKS